MRNSVWCLAFDYVFSWAICKNYSSNWDLESETSVIWANDSNYVAPPDCSSTSWHAASARKKHSANLTCVICHTKKENIQTHLWIYICISTCRKYTNTLVDLYMHINMQEIYKHTCGFIYAYQHAGRPAIVCTGDERFPNSFQTTPGRSPQHITVTNTHLNCNLTRTVALLLMQTRIWWVSDGCPMGVWWVSDGCPMGVWGVSDGCLMGPSP